MPEYLLRAGETGSGGGGYELDGELFDATPVTRLGPHAVREQLRRLDVNEQDPVRLLLRDTVAAAFRALRDVTLAGDIASRGKSGEVLDRHHAAEHCKGRSAAKIAGR